MGIGNHICQAYWSSPDHTTVPGTHQACEMLVPRGAMHGGSALLLQLEADLSEDPGWGWQGGTLGRNQVVTASWKDRVTGVRQGPQLREGI